MDKWRVIIPTYGAHRDIRESAVKETTDPPQSGVPAAVYLNGGLRIILGSHCYDDLSAPDVLIQRHPLGWAISLHPCGGGDPSGHVYFLDDGRSFVMPESEGGPTPPISVVQCDANTLETDLGDG